MVSRSHLFTHFVAFLTVAVWGSTFVFTKMLLQAGLTPAQIFTFRFLIAYVLLLAFSMRKQHQWFCSSWKDETLMVALGITGGSLYFLTENAAMLFTTATNTSLIVCSCPLFAMLLVAIVYRHSEHITKVQALGSIIACIGMAVVVLNGHFVLHLSPLGDLLAFGACLCWAVYSLLMKKALEEYPTLFITRKVFIYGLITIIPYYILSPQEASIFSSSILQLFNPSILFNLLFLGIVASLLCYLIWNWVISRLGAVVATNWVYFNPITTILFAWWLLHEQITVWFLLGTILILTGMYLSDKKKK
ncbi:MAG: DMT family transporter [Prevotella sp.]|nr:DMT family transporter [Prevotella sp.]